MEIWRVEELGQRAGLSVEVIRSYQSKGLLPPPRHQGRVALYGPRHLERLGVIRDLKAKGHSLRAVATMLREPLRPVNPFIAGELADEERLTLADVAERTGMPVPMLRSLEASGVLRPVHTGSDALYTSADVRAVRMLLMLVGSGVPMEEFMSVADIQLEAADEVARSAVELFMRYIREPLLAAGLPQRQEAERMVASFRLLVKAASGLISYNFERTMLDTVQKEIEARGTKSERAAIRREAARRNSVA
ncbi:MAG TPA: MerR family transcriptional regulator [Acidimicrobiales bacterium]|nr:MerR family transcriptional regulator [Acidimicrobiales bacterium]